MGKLIIPEGATEFQFDAKRGIIHFGKNGGTLSVASTGGVVHGRC